ncbi:hypothetical protein BpHYR1_007128 [Brachionus plicatilis]|uniref:Uncharacterized protein n=1 Tax=Brachionus plicatilis TaxID=10195 RepID=A0A3M7QDU3_BRAPC|nr:hypothetical protein BpHYR1_007128 [Brachionus plicatilis]
MLFLTTKRQYCVYHRGLIAVSWFSLMLNISFSFRCMNFWTLILTCIVIKNDTRDTSLSSILIELILKYSKMIVNRALNLLRSSFVDFRISIIESKSNHDFFFKILISKSHVPLIQHIILLQRILIIVKFHPKLSSVVHFMILLRTNFTPKIFISKISEKHETIKKIRKNLTADKNAVLFDQPSIFSLFFLVKTKKQGFSTDISIFYLKSHFSNSSKILIINTLVLHLIKKVHPKIENLWIGLYHQNQLLNHKFDENDKKYIQYNLKLTCKFNSSTLPQHFLDSSYTFPFPTGKLLKKVFLVSRQFHVMLLFPTFKFLVQLNQKLIFKSRFKFLTPTVQSLPITKICISTVEIELFFNPISHNMIYRIQTRGLKRGLFGLKSAQKHIIQCSSQLRIYNCSIYTNKNIFITAQTFGAHSVHSVNYTTIVYQPFSRVFNRITIIGNFISTLVIQTFILSLIDFNK